MLKSGVWLAEENKQKRVKIRFESYKIISEISSKIVFCQ